MQENLDTKDCIVPLDEILEKSDKRIKNDMYIL